MYYNSAHLCQKTISGLVAHSLQPSLSAQKHTLSWYIFEGTLSFSFNALTLLPSHCVSMSAAEVCTEMLPAVLQVICDRLPKADSNPVLHQNLVTNSGRATGKRDEREIKLCSLLSFSRPDVKNKSSSSCKQKKKKILKNKSQNQLLCPG